jgi:hypothetical protein
MLAFSLLQEELSLLQDVSLSCVGASSALLDSSLFVVLPYSSIATNNYHVVYRM